MLEAVRNLTSKNTELLIIGDGDQQNIKTEKLKRYNLIGKVHLLGRRSKQEVMKYLMVSDLFVFPSREDIWGLVLNEAIFQGLPIISTKHVGAFHSLIKENENGYMINADSPLELAEILN